MEHQIALGGLRGPGEIFFVPDARLGAALAAAVTLGDRRAGITMIAASTAAVAIGHVAGAPAWQVEQGLAGFTPALVAVATLSGFAGLGRTAVAIASGALVEAGVLRLAMGLGVHALSTSYLWFVWVFAVLRPVRDAAADRRGWSSMASGRPRRFDDGRAAAPRDAGRYFGVTLPPILIVNWTLLPGSADPGSDALNRVSSCSLWTGYTAPSAIVVSLVPVPVIAEIVALSIF
jgi:hypothetical protein